MKKRYLLTLAAGLICSMAANAETLLADSVVTCLADGTKSLKDVYEYTEAGKESKQLSYAWDAAAGDWKLTRQELSTYDEAGNLTTWKVQAADGEAFKDSVIVTSEYDNQNRIVKSLNEGLLTDTEILTEYAYDGKNVEVLTTTTKPDSEGALTKSYSKLEQVLNDDDLVIEARTYNYKGGGPENEDSWFLSVKIETSYVDAKGAIDKQRAESYNSKGELFFENNTSYERDGKNWVQTQQYKRVNEKDWTYIYQRNIFEGENPEVLTKASSMTGEDDDWTVGSIVYTYYPTGGTTANESIAPIPTIQVFASDGMIKIETAENQSVQIFGINGYCYYNATVNGYTTVNLPAGIYVVRAGEQSIKVSVR